MWLLPLGETGVVAMAYQVAQAVILKCIFQATILTTTMLQARCFFLLVVVGLASVVLVRVPLAMEVGAVALVVHQPILRVEIL